MQPSPALRDLISERDLLVCVGPGGVGKTTVAAALGLACARLGHRTLVLTIDPAKRLAEMLGLAGLDDSEIEVQADTPAPLFAAMLDTGASYDALIHRIAHDPEHRQQILSNRIYRLMSRSFGQSHAYVAMERLYAALDSGEYTRIILDTPPTRNALDILDAPGRLATFLDEEALQWFIRTPTEGLRSRLLARGGAAAARLLQVLIGPQLVTELREFLQIFLALREGFRRRAEVVTTRLRARSTGFLLVTSPRRGNLDDAHYLHTGLRRRQIETAAIVCNQAHLALGAQDPCTYIEMDTATLSDCLPLASRADVDTLGRAINLAQATIAAANRENHCRFAEFVTELATEAVAIKAPQYKRELRSLTDLTMLSDILLGPSPDCELDSRGDRT